VYIGLIRLSPWKKEEEERIPGLHEPIVDESVFRRVQTVLKSSGRDTSKKTKLREELPLRGHILCRRCGRLLTGSASKGRNARYFYYHCRNGCKERLRAEKANDIFLRYLRCLRPKLEVVELYQAVLRSVLLQQESDTELELHRLDTKLKSIDDKILNADKKYLDDRIDRESYERVKASYERERDSLEVQVVEIGTRDSSSVEYLKFGVNLLKNLDDYYQAASVEVKKRLIGSIFSNGIVIHGEECRTAPQNKFISLICCNYNHLHLKKENESPKTEDSSHLVAPTVQLSNRLMDELRRLYDLQPLIKTIF